MVRLRNHESHFYVDVLEDLHTFLSKIFALMPWLRLFKNINHILSRPYDVSTSPLSFIFHDYLLINVREHRRGNQKRTIQRNLQHSVIRKLFIKNQTFVSPSTTLERTMKWTYVSDPFLWNQYHDIPVVMIPFYEINIMISLLLWSRSMKSISWYPCCYDPVLWNQYHDIPVDVMAVVYMFMIPFRALHHHFYYKSNLDSTIRHAIIETDNPSKVFELDDIIVRINVRGILHNKLMTWDNDWS